MYRSVSVQEAVDYFNTCGLSQCLYLPQSAQLSRWERTHLTTSGWGEHPAPRQLKQQLYRSSHLWLVHLYSPRDFIQMGSTDLRMQIGITEILILFYSIFM